MQWPRQCLLLVCFLCIFVGNGMHGRVGPILPGQSLWCINQRIGLTTFTEVSHCTIIKSGKGSNDPDNNISPGRAIQDLANNVGSPTSGSKIFYNFAYDIADTAVRYNIHNTGVESGVAVSDPPMNATIENATTNYFVQ